jgi:hypothetical protein
VRAQNETVTSYQKQFHINLLYRGLSAEKKSKYANLIQNLGARLTLSRWYAWHPNQISTFYRDFFVVTKRLLASWCRAHFRVNHSRLTSFRIKRICRKDDPENGYNILTLPPPLPRLILPVRPPGARRNLYNKLSRPGLGYCRGNTGSDIIFN